MLTVLQLIFSPAKTWEAIAQKGHGVIWIFTLSLLPLVALGCAAEGYSLMKYGIPRGLMGHHAPVSQEVAIYYAALQLGLSVVLLFGGSKFIQWIAEGFHFFPRYRQIFTAFGYGLGPIFLLRIMNCVPVASSWAWWLLGAAIMVFILYQGVALVIEPEQTKGFGFYLLSTLAIVMMSGSAQAIALAILNAKLTPKF